FVVRLHVPAWGDWCRRASLIAMRSCSFVMRWVVIASNGLAAFGPRTAEERAKALGDLGSVPLELRVLLTPEDDFDLIPLPKAGDWLAVHVEPGQTFEDYRTGGANRPDSTR